jgi:cytochrome c oxidase accessory protein FixG
MELPTSDKVRTYEDALIQPKGRVLSTLEADGSRRWLMPRLARGKLFNARRIVAYLLLALFIVTPYISVGNYPIVLLDVLHRRFHILGATFLPTDTVLLALLVLMAGLSIFLFTAIAGRVFCGWACPQTVYLEFVYRPIERLFYGTTGRGGKPKNVPVWRRIALHAVYLVVSIHLAHTALSYFVGAKAVNEFIWHSSPFSHPAAFIMVAIITAWMMWDFCFWREQMCLIGCPYGRLQSVLLDPWSLIVSYDAKRGEPRGKKVRMKEEGGRMKEQVSLSSLILQPSSLSQGDCIDCTMCVQVCPTGIDIRDGLQFECVNCTQCIDACDTVMDRIEKPRGLIGYSSQAARAGERVRWIRPRVVIYPLMLLVLGSLFTYLLFNRSPFDLTVLRAQGRPFVVTPGGSVENTMRFKIVNRTEGRRTYRVESMDPQIQFINTDTTQGVTLDPLETAVEPFQVRVPGERFVRDHLDIEVRVTSDDGQSVTRFVRLVGPANFAGAASISR